MRRKGLGIMFLIGLGIFGITVALLFSGSIKFVPDTILILIVPIVIGVLLMMLSATKLLRRFDNYLDRD